MSKRITHKHELMTRDAMVASSSGRMATQTNTADLTNHPIQVNQCKQDLLDCASELFRQSKHDKYKEESKAKEAELFQQIGKLQIDLEWLNNYLSCSVARELLKPIDPDHCELSVNRQCALSGNPIDALPPVETGSEIDAANHGQQRCS
jgi:putative transposase